MAGAIVRSALREAIRNIPEGTTLKQESVVPQLLKKGVKEEELTFSGFEVPEGQAGRVTQEELVEAETQRKDWWNIKEIDTGWQGFRNMEGGRNNPTYRERIYEFGQKGEEDRRFVSSHYAEQSGNYLAHASVFDNTINGSDSRVLFEIQSDLHQQGRQIGYREAGLPSIIEVPTEQAVEWHKVLSDAMEADKYVEVRQQLMRESGIDDEVYFDTLHDHDVEDLRALSDYNYDPEILEQQPPKSPWERTWLRKTIEQEYVRAINDGKQQLVIPISGDLQTLQRADGVQRWYETQVLNTAKKVARQTGGTFEIVTEGATEGSMPAWLGDMPPGARQSEVSDFMISTLSDWLDEDNFDAVLSAAREVGMGDLVERHVDIMRGSDSSAEAIQRAEDRIIAHIANATRTKIQPGNTGITYAIIKPAVEESTEQVGMINKDALNWLPADSFQSRASVERAVDKLFMDTFMSEETDDLFAIAKDLKLGEDIRQDLLTMTSAEWDDLPADIQRTTTRRVQDAFEDAFYNTANNKGFTPEEIAADTARWNQANKNMLRSQAPYASFKNVIDVDAAAEPYQIASKVLDYAEEQFAEGAKRPGDIIDDVLGTLPENTQQNVIVQTTDALKVMARLEPGSVEYEEATGILGDILTMAAEASKGMTRESASKAKAELQAELAKKYGLAPNQAINTVKPEDLLVNRQTTTPKPFSVTMYAGPTGVAFAAYNALEQGYSEDEVRSYLQENGYDYDQMAPVLMKIQQAKAAGYSDEEIREYMNAQEPQATMVENNPATLYPKEEVEADARRVENGRMTDEEVQNKYKMTRFDFLANAREKPSALTISFDTDSPKDESLNAIMNIESIEDVRSLVAHMEVIKPTMTSTIMTDIPAMFGNEAAMQRYQAASQSSQLAIQKLAQEKFGIQLTYDNEAGHWLVQGENGQMARVTPGMWEAIKKSKGEFIGGTAGAITGTIAGGRAGLAATGPFKQLFGRFAAPASAFGGGVAGGIVGAMLGTEFDYMMSAMTMHEEMNAEIAAHKAMTAAELAVIGEAIGYPVAKTLGLGWRGILRAKNMIFEGNSQGAYRALKEVAFLDDSQIEEIVAGLERHAPLEGSAEQKGIQAVLQTQPGMQEVVRAASDVDNQAARAVVKSTTDRAAAILDMTSNITKPDELISRQFVQDLGNYRADVQDFYNTVKERAVNSPNANNFSFDFEALTIEPILERLQNNITDPTVSQRFLLQAGRIRTLSESRDFGDLIELRQLVNDFLFNKNIAKRKDADMLRGLISNIDEAIEEGAPSVVQNPEQWLNDWAKARADYAQMKSVERTALYRAIFDKKGNVRPVQPATVVKALGKYITSLDGSFMDVMSQLPVKARGEYEGAVVNHLTEKWTMGVKGGMKATNFVELAKELDMIRLTTADARAAKNAILEMADVFQNDIYLAQASGQMKSPHFQSYLTTDPVVRAKFEIASGLFNYIKTWVPGQAQRNSALVKQAAKLLEKPLDVRAAKLLQEEFMDSPEILSAVRALQQASAQMAAKDQMPTTPMVKVFENGMLKGTNQIDTIPAHRIATLEQVRQIAEAEALTMESKVLDQVLEQYGYKAVMSGSDRVRILGGK